MNRRQKKAKISQVKKIYAESCGSRVARLERERLDIKRQFEEHQVALIEAERRRVAQIKWNARREKNAFVAANKPKFTGEIW